MINIGKSILVLCFLINAAELKSQEHKSNFKLIFNFGNHAEGLFVGASSVYILTDTSLTFIKRTSYNTKSDSVVFSTINSTSVLNEIKSIPWNGLKDYYHNYCVMSTSGNEYFFTLKTGSVSKNIILHHYYLKEIDHLVNCLNKILPSSYKIRYLTPDTKQDCKL